MYDDLRKWLEDVDEHGELKRVKGASWDLEMSSIAEIMQGKAKEPVPSILFDDIPGYPKGYRTLWVLLGSAWRVAKALGLPTNDLSRMALVKNLHEKVKKPN